jgi:uncharacterized membrane protein
MAIAKTIFWLALVVWLGEIVFFSFVVAPTIFGAFPTELAGQVVGAIFPRYYAVGAAAGVVALVAAVVLRGATSSTRSWSAITAMLVVMLVATLYAGRIIEPRARALRPQLHAEAVDATVRAEFDQLHRRAVQLNGAVLLLGVVSICLAAATLQLPRR